MQAEDMKYIQKLKLLGRHFPQESKKDESIPIRVAVTGAAGQIGFFLCFMIAQGRMFGPYQKVILHLLELPAAEGPLKGLVMELKDGAFPLVADIVPSTDVNVAFNGIDAAVLVGARPRGPGMERKDLLTANAAIFKAQGEALDKYAKKSVKVLVVGNPANTNALIASHYAPSLPKKNFTALTRLDQNRAVSQLADKTSSRVEDIKNVVIWGNHSLTQYPSVQYGKIGDQSIIKAVADDKYLKGEFIPKVAKRGGEIISVMKKSSAASAANAACDHMHDWFIGTKQGEYCSMGIITDGSQYGIAAGICYSFPTECRNGDWTVVKGLELNAYDKELITKSEKELLDERKMALDM